MGKSTRKKQAEKELEDNNILSVLKTPCSKKIKLKNNMDFSSFSELMPHTSARLLDYFSSCRIRNISDWRLKNKSINNAVISLFNYLYVKYRYPLFFNDIFFSLDLKNSYSYFRWFMIIGKGDSLYKRVFKDYDISKRETYYFITAPSYIKNPSDAVLFALTKAAVNDKNNYRKYFDLFISNRCFPENFYTYSYYRKAFRFLCKQDFFDLKECYREISDYLFRSGIASTNFEFKNRTLNSIKNLSNIWHIEVASKNKAGDYSWEPLFPGAPKVWTTENENYSGWKCVELTTSRELCKEGKEMHHCIASYARSCKEGRSHIFKFFNNDIDERYTIEVVSRNIIQCQGRYSTRMFISKTAKSAIRFWAKDRGIRSSMIK